MTITTAVLTVGFVAVVTYLMRAGLILTLADRSLPPLITRALRSVAPAVLAALTVSLIADPAQANRGITVAELVGVVVACFAAWRTRNLIVTLAAGMICFWIVLSLG